MRQGNIYVEVKEYPLKDVLTVDDLKKALNFPIFPSLAGSITRRPW